MKCIFCEIIDKNIPSYVIYEDDICIAILDKEQITAGHILVIPKKHYINFFDIDESILLHMMLIIKKIVKKMEIKLDVSNLNIVNNSGSLADQIIFHFHIHIIPRYETNTNINYSMEKLAKLLSI